MDWDKLLEHMNSKRTVQSGSDIQRLLDGAADAARKLTVQLNNSYHNMAEIRELFSQITGKPVPESFAMFPPFYTDCGRNITVGENVFINAGCQFQDQGGITIEDGSQIGHNVVLATLNHDLSPLRRRDLHPAPVRIGKNVWIGSNATVCPGVTIGDGAVVAAGAIPKQPHRSTDTALWLVSACCRYHGRYNICTLRGGRSGFPEGLWRLRSRRVHLLRH